MLPEAGTDVRTIAPHGGPSAWPDASIDAALPDSGVDTVAQDADVDVGMIDGETD